MYKKTTQNKGKTRNQIPVFLPHYTIYPVFVLNSNKKIVYVNPAAQEAFPGLRNKKLKHPVFSGLNFDFIKKTKKTITREALVGSRWYKQTIRYIPKEKSFIFYNSNVTERVKAEDWQHDFVAILGHELRNPIAPIVLSLDLLKGKKIDDPDIKEIFETIRHQTGNMAKLIKDILDVARAEKGKIELQKEETDLGLIIENAIKAAEPLIKSNNQVLKLQLPRGAVRIFADPLRIEQILINLLNNASKYSGDGESIDVKVEKNKEDVLIKVKDNGIGIPPKNLRHIFDMFGQSRQYRSNKKGGLGIGLFLARELARLHGGDVCAYSKGEDKGSEFTLRLPLKTGLNKKNNKMIQEDYSKALKPQKRILVLDDNIPLANAIGKFLGGLNYETKVLYNGPSALNVIEKFKPDMALIDIGMPGMSGFEVAKEIRTNSNLKKLTLVAITGYNQKAYRESAKEAGFDYYLVKPIGAQSIYRVLAGDACSFRL